MQRMIFIIALISLLACGMVSCSQTQSTSTTTSTSLSTSTTVCIIKGPDVGTSAEVIYIGSEGNGIFKSTDGGATFTKVADLRNYIDTH
ncbi:MAG: hypothetical protein ABIA67_03940 [Candidatus Margulisiibacteriota bacterium]